MSLRPLFYLFLSGRLRQVLLDMFVCALCVSLFIFVLVFLPCAVLDWYVIYAFPGHFHF